MIYKTDFIQDLNEPDPLKSRHFEALMKDYKEARFGGLEFENIKKWLYTTFLNQEKDNRLYSNFSVQNPDRSPHWSEGGTAVTNFGEDQVGKYLKAIEKYGDSSLFVGHPTSKGFISDFALRRSGRMRGDLSAFWRIFDSIE